MERVEIPNWVRLLWDRSKGKSFEPKQHDSAGVRWLIENGFMKRVDGRCGFEAFRDSMLAWTAAGRAALSEHVPTPEPLTKAERFCGAYSDAWVA